MEGLKRLLKNEKFANAESAAKVQEQYERSSDTVKAFLEEWTENDGSSSVPKGELWEAFEEYCKKYNVPLSFTKRTFGSKMRGRHTESTIKIDGNSVRVWQGIKLTRGHGLRIYASHGSTIASEHSEKNKSIKESSEKGEKRGSVTNKKLEEMFEK